MIDYDEASRTYDNTRGADGAVIGLMAERGVLGRAARGERPAPSAARASTLGRPARPSVLDFGCGTGNYLQALSERFDCDLCGLEPSDEMRTKAIEKNPGLRIEKGDHASMPFEDASFDFVYMTDVIHHVPDLDLLFESLRAKLRPGGLICVVTESWAQIEARWYNAYFPSLAANEKARYPDIGTIERHAGAAGLGRAGTDLIAYPGPHAVDDSFLRMVSEKNYSMFRQLAEAEFEAGLVAMRTRRGQSFLSPGAGQTLIWLSKGGA